MTTPDARTLLERAFQQNGNDGIAIVAIGLALCDVADKMNTMNALLDVACDKLDRVERAVDHNNG